MAVPVLLHESADCLLSSWLTNSAEQETKRLRVLRGLSGA